MNMTPPSLGSIKFLTGSMAGNNYPITKSVITIGREPGNDIVVSDPSVSRQHVQISWNNGQWAISKLAPQNTMTVNQRETQQSPLKDRDTVSLGSGTTFIFQSSSPPLQASPSAGSPGLRGPAAPSSQPQADAQRPFQQPNSPWAAPPPPDRFAPQQPSSPLQQQPAIQSSFAPSAPMPTVAAPPFANRGPARNGPQDFPMPGPLMTSPDNAKMAAPAGAATLEVSTNTDHEKQTYPLTQQVINIGRDPSNTIVINRPTISGFHAQIVREGNQLVFIHPHPSRGKTLNGITYKGETIPGDQQFRHVLTRGDVFRVSDENGTFVTLTYNDGSGSAQDIIPEIRPIPLGGALITLGRAADNMVELNHPQVSTHHARLEQVQGGYRIVDLGSTNHTYVNAERIHAQLLKPGDEIRIGPFKLTYTGTQLTQHDESNSIRIDALRLTKKGTRQAILINDISLAIPPRKFVAVVGGSGAGKSTLMDALNGLRPAQNGTVLYNGQDYYHHLAAFSTQLGYVPQDDIIHRDLTVERALFYAAKLRLPSDFTRKQIKERINEVLVDVDMTKRRHLLVNKLSGGQRKRVSIALELLANPSVFFLDEPTSGLDPGLDRKMMLLMRNLADKGRTIVLVTHATNNINACDYVCFLCQGGRLAYFGPPNEAKAFFGKTDFAEIYSALEPTDENPNIPAEAEQRFKESPDYRRYVVDPLNQGPAGQANNQQLQTAAVRPPKRGNPLKQFRLLAMRYLELLKNDVGNLAILLLQAPIIGLVLYFLTAKDTFKQSSIAVCVNPLDTAKTADCGSVLNFLNSPQGDAIRGTKTAIVALQQFILPGSGADAQKILFIMAFAAVLFGCINGSREIVKEAAIYKRERSVNLGIMPYMFSKIVVLGILCLLQSLVLTLFVNASDPFRTNIFTGLSPLVEIYISMALTSLAGLMTGLAISAVVPNNDRAMSIVPLALIPQVIFAGVIFSLDKPPLLQILGAFFPARWAMAAMGSSIGLHTDKLQADDFSYHGTLFSTFSKTDAEIHLLITWSALVLTCLVLGIAIAFFLKRKDVRV